MTTLDSPLEVFAFDYISFVFNNLWTWIAVVTAAVSFWRLRFITTNDGLIDESSLPDEPTKPQDKTTDSLLVVPRVKVTETDVWSPLIDGVTKGKLTVYYEEEINVMDDNDGYSTSVKYGGGESEEWWESVVTMRNGDDGWYRYVDLTVLNGNVVRLWDANGVRNGGWISVQRKDYNFS